MTAAILMIRPAAPPGTVTGDEALDRLFALDRLLVSRPLVCRWRRDAAGALAASWEPD